MCSEIVQCPTVKGFLSPLLIHCSIMTTETTLLHFSFFMTGTHNPLVYYHVAMNKQCLYIRMYVHDEVCMYIICMYVHDEVCI